MPPGVRGVPNRLQISGRRYLMRRLERATLFGDPSCARPVRAPLVAVACGAGAAAVALAAVVALAWMRPAAGIGDAAIVMVRGTGALYVRIDDTVHPVANLTSARLIIGRPDTPKVLDEAALYAVDRGPALGIPGLPAAIGEPMTPQSSSWTVCDGDRTTVFAGPGPAAAPEQDPVLVESASGKGYLIYEGRRAAVDTTDPAIRRALGVDSLVPRRASPALLALLPEGPPLAVPPIPGAGNPGPGALRGHPVGEVVRVARAAGAGNAGVDHYVVLAGGVQRIPRTAADALRFAFAGAGSEIPDVDPGLLNGIPSVGVLPLSGFPDRSAGAGAGPLCVRWVDGRSEILTSRTRPTSPPATELAQADGPGPAVDAVSVPAGRSVYVRTGGAGWVIADSGLRLGLADEAAAAALGLSGRPAAGPWPLLSLLPSGPSLSREAALLARDGAYPR